MLRKVSLIVFLLFLVLAVYVAFKTDRNVTTSSSEAYEHYQAGVKWQEQLYLRQAMVEFERAVALDSEFAVAQARLADVYYGLGFVKKGQERRALALKYRDKLSPREQLLLDGYKCQWDGDREKAQQLAEEMFRQYPNDLDAMNAVAYIEWGNNNFERSLELFQGIIKKFPDHAPAYNMLGYLNYYLGRYDDALAMLDKYIELSRDQANPHDSRGEILYALGRYEEAINEFRQAFNINPDLDFTVLHMSQAYQALGQNRQTDYCFDILNGQAPNDAKRLQYAINYASRLIQREELDSAKNLIAAAVDKALAEKSEMTGDAAFTLGVIYYRQRNLDSLRYIWSESRKYVEEKFKEQPALAEANNWKISERFMLASEADLAGNLDEAARLFSEIVALAPTPDEKMGYRWYYGDILLRKGDIDLAISELQKNLSINPNNARTLVKLGDIYEAANDRASAQAYRERAAEVWKNADPDFKPLLLLKKKLQTPLASAAQTARS